MSIEQEHDADHIQPQEHESLRRRVTSKLVEKLVKIIEPKPDKEIHRENQEPIIREAAYVVINHDDPGRGTREPMSRERVMAVIEGFEPHFEPAIRSLAATKVDVGKADQ
ncbi:MAG TPA: hypothetical protein VH144_03195 [Candidatus Saccharimonadales bacterium]|nr:hypothetical protein [Candidatus Saccharimonadales bacterium]